MLAGINLLFNPSIAFTELKTQSQYRIHPRIKFTRRFTVFGAGFDKSTSQ